MGHCEWTAMPSKPGRPQTNVSFNTTDTLWDGPNTVLIQISLLIASFSYIYILQGSVATLLTCRKIFNNHFIANCPESVLVKDCFWKLVNISRRYRNNKLWHFLRHSVLLQTHHIIGPECRISCIRQRWVKSRVPIRQTNAFNVFM